MCSSLSVHDIIYSIIANSHIGALIFKFIPLSEENISSYKYAYIQNTRPR